jgi:hypothetical protein
VAVAVLVAVEVAVGVAVAVLVGVEVRVAVAVEVTLGVGVAVAVEVPVGVGVAVGVKVGVGVGTGPAPVVKTDLKLSFMTLPSSALTVPTNLNLYLVLVASAFFGVKITVSPWQRIVAAEALTRLSRKDLGPNELQFIGMLKVTMILVSIETFVAPSTGLVEVTTGFGPLDEAFAGAAAPAHIIITNAATEILLTVRTNIIEAFFVTDMGFISSFSCFR